MGIDAQAIADEIERGAPLGMQEGWDNSGWQIRLGGDVGTVLVALEITDAAIDEAAAIGAGMVLTHHPLFFVPPRALDAGTTTGGYALRLAREGISVYSAHTSFDSAPGGMNDCLAALIGLERVRPFPGGARPDDAEEASADRLPVDGLMDLPPSTGDGAPAHAMARAGRFAEPLAFGELCRRVELAIGMEGRLKTVGDPAKAVATCAVCGGGGGDLVGQAIDAGLDCYLTSDVKHHEAQWAKERGFCLIDGGHYATERLFVPEMARRLRTAFGDALRVAETSADQDPWRPWGSLGE